MSNSFPRVLIVNQQSIRKNNATGITLRSLWADWPIENVMEIYLDEFETHVDYKPGFMSLCIPSNWLNKIAHSGSAKKINSGIKQQEIQTKSSIKNNVRQAIVLGLNMISVTVPRDIQKQIYDFKPEIIYTLGASVKTLDLAYRLSKKYEIPILIHYMDNWPENLQWEDNKLIKPYRYALDRKLKSCLERSTAGLAISPQMAEAYEKKFGMPFSSVMNSVDVDSFHLEKKVRGNILKFVYAGGLHLNRWKALLDINRAIEENDINAELHIYTSVESADLYRSQFSEKTFFHNPVEHSKILDVYRDADVLVHTETANPLLLGFFKYSISTKIPEYLASGRVVLFYGPKELGLFSYLESNKAAFTADGYEELCKTLKTIERAQTNDMILDNAINLAYANHDALKSRTVLKDAVYSCVEVMKGK